MLLSGPEFEKLQQALISAFDEPSLRQMLRIRLEENLAAITRSGTLSDVVFDLISWAERNGRTSDLVSAAVTHNPHNPELAAFAAQYFSAFDARSLTIDADVHSSSSSIGPEERAVLRRATQQPHRRSDQPSNFQALNIQQLIAESDIQDQNNRRVLRQMVKSYWIDGVLVHSIDHEAAIRLGFADKSSLVDNRPWRVIPSGDQLGHAVPNRLTLIEEFDCMHQRMLILGEPGAGKTTALLELACDLIQRADEIVGLHSPVVLNLSSWILRKAPLSDWLVDELDARYMIPRKLAKKWIDQDKLLLLLDGLDEVQTQDRKACAEAINQFLQQHLVPVAVCCRIAEYENLGVQLKLHGAIQLQPLTKVQIDEYLNRAGPALMPLRMALQSDTQLRELAESPLMLSIMALAYQDADSKALSPSLATSARREQLFDAYIERMFIRREVAPVCHPKQTLRRLQWLSERLIQYGQSVFLLEHMQPTWLQSANGSTILRWYMLLVGPLSGLAVGLMLISLVGSGPGLIFGLLIGMIAGLIDAVAGRYKHIRPLEQPSALRKRLKSSLYTSSCWIMVVYIVVGLRSGANVGLTYSLAFGVIGGVLGGFLGIEPARQLRQIWPRFKRNLKLGLVGYGVSVGTVSGLILTIAGKQPYDFLAGMLTCIALGLFVGLVLAFLFQATPENEDRVMLETQIPNQGIRLSARYAILTGIAAGLLFGAGGWLVGGPHYGFLLGLSGGLCGILIGGGDSVTKHAFLRLGLYVQGHVPRNYARFLDYAVALIFLRKVGGGYIFIHRLVMEHFAKLTDQDIDRLTASLDPDAR